MVELALAPGAETSATELGQRLGISRDSVHQLLRPLVQAGLAFAGRGRHGGYRASATALGASAEAVVAPFSRERAGEADADDRKSPPFVRALERRTREASRDVLAGTSLRALAEEARAEREAFTYVI